MRVAIHQPQYWPWPPYLQKALAADVFVYLDTVQFSKNGLQNRNQVKTANGAAWLTLPVRQGLGQRLDEVELADARAPGKHLRTLAAAYAGTPGYLRYREELEELLSRPWERLAELAIASTEWLLGALGAEARRIRASELAATGTGSQLVAAICAELGADEYLSGSGGLAYMERGDFERAGCAVLLQRWQGFEYPQRFSEQGFVPDLSALDLVLNAPDEARELVAGAGTLEPWA